MDNYNRERTEAVLAGQRALESLRRAEEELDKARGWGMFDMFGGGLFTTMIKRSKMNNAQGYLETARMDLRAFSRELIDIDINFNTADFLAFADYFFDGLLADYLVQSRINQTRRQVAEAIRRVEQILSMI